MAGWDLGQDDPDAVGVFEVYLGQAPGRGSLRGGAGGLGSRPRGTGMSLRRAWHPDRAGGGPALRSAEVALGRLAADGALEPEVTLVRWRTALTRSTEPIVLDGSSARRR